MTAMKIIRSFILCFVFSINQVLSKGMSVIFRLLHIAGIRVYIMIANGVAISATQVNLASTWVGLI